MENGAGGCRAVLRKGWGRWADAGAARDGPRGGGGQTKGPCPGWGGAFVQGITAAPALSRRGGAAEQVLELITRM